MARAKGPIFHLGPKKLIFRNLLHHKTPLWAGFCFISSGNKPVSFVRL